MLPFSSFLRATSALYLALAAALLASPAALRADDPPAQTAAQQKAAEAAKKADEARLAREAKQKADDEAAAAKAALKAIIDRADSCAKIKITRSPDDVFQAVARMSEKGDQGLAEDQRYLLYIQAGEWENLRDLIAVFPAEQAQRLYGKVANDLMFASPKPLFLPTDVLRLADAAPTELDDKQTLQMGKLLSYAIAKNESRAELTSLLQKGTARLGGNDPARRHAAARVLAAAEFWNEAKLFGLKESEIPEVAAGVKPDAAKPTQPDWEPLVALLRDPARTAQERDEALTSLHQAMVQSTPETVKNRLDPLLRDAAHPDLAWDIIALIGRKTARSQIDFDYSVRRINLELQATAMRLLAAGRPLGTQPASAFANLYARNWLAESQLSLAIFPTWKKAAPEARDKYQHVGIEDLLGSAPTGDWLAVLEPQLASSVKLLVARLTLVSDNADRLIPQLAEIVSRDKTTAAELANAYLLRWAQRHDPSFTPEAMKLYKLEGHSIVLTRAEQEQSLRQLGQLLSKLDPETRKLLDEGMAVTAFDLCHSKAEIYTRDEIVQVFGPLENVSPSLLLSLLERMRTKLGLHWRNLTVQRDAATKRTAEDVFELVDEGYAEAETISAEWLRAHPEDWRTTCTAGSILAEWAEFAYFQAVASEATGDRFATYLQRSAAALERFREGAKAYAAAVPKMARSDFSLLPYRAWFYGLLGIAHDGDINLRKGVTRESLTELSQAIRSLPKGAGGVHLQMFSTMVADNVKANVIAPQMKYRYLSSAVEITGRNATVYPAEEKVQYYESLLREIRLRSRLDGADRIRHHGEFGVFVSLVHTADLAREAGGFGKYLQNEIRRTVSGKTVVEQPLYRDRFEEALRLALADFFEIKAIVFADPNAGARAMIPDLAEGAEEDSGDADPARSRWQETPLAYLHLVAKDATVDRVPPLEIELDFFDRDGKVVIPLPSTPLLIEVAADAPARREAAQIAITEIVDARELAEHKRLKLDVVATAHGLVPDLEELIDLAEFGLSVLNVDDREGQHVSELHSGDDGLYAVSQRNWTLELDPQPLLRGASERVEFRFPQPKSSEIAVTYRTYKDMDPVDAAAQVTLVEGKDAAAIAQPHYLAWTLGVLAVILIAGLAAAALWWKKPASADDRPPAFVMPREATPFAVVSLLHRIEASPEAQLTGTQRDELRRKIVALERSAFATETSLPSQRDLETLADLWIRTALPAAKTVVHHSA